MDARRQQSKCLELRAAMSMARLWRDQGERHEHSRASRSGLRLVHPRLRHARSERGQGLARRVAMKVWSLFGRRDFRPSSQPMRISRSRPGSASRRSTPSIVDPIELRCYTDSTICFLKVLRGAEIAQTRMRLVREAFQSPRCLCRKILNGGAGEPLVSSTAPARVRLRCQPRAAWA
jgi:hypothetical protein